MNLPLKNIDLTIIAWARRLFVPVARIAFFVIYFYFGILKVLDLSPATPLAEALTAQTIGMQYFHSAYIILAIFECLIGILFLIPKATRLVIPVLFIHMLIVCSPLILVPQLAWTHPFVPSLEGQYIIKNVALIAVAIGIVASTMPLTSQAAKRASR